MCLPHTVLLFVFAGVSYSYCITLVLADDFEVCFTYTALLSVFAGESEVRLSHTVLPFLFAGEAEACLSRESSCVYQLRTEMATLHEL